MADSIDRLVGTGTAVKIKGKEYRLSPLTIADFGEISAFVKAQRLKVCAFANPDLTLQEKIQITEERPSEKEIDTVLSDISGLTFQVWLHVKHNHPTITLKDMAEMIDKDNYKQIYEAVSQVNANPNADGQTVETP